MLVSIQDGKVVAEADGGEVRRFAATSKGARDYVSFIEIVGEIILCSSSVDFPQEDGMEEGFNFDEWEALADVIEG